MEFKLVEGEKKGSIKVYALSTCAWCKKTKAYLNDQKIEYSYIDVDRVPSDEMESARKEVMKYNPRCSFPTIVINDKCIVGFKPDEIREALK